MKRRRKRERNLTLAEIYGCIPDVHCKGLCQESCGPIAMSNEEDRRLRAHGVTIPPMADMVAAMERGEEYWYPCPEGRPVQRVPRPADNLPPLGATNSMRCPHGCTPPNALTRKESYELLVLPGRAGGGMAPGAFEPTRGQVAPEKD